MKVKITNLKFKCIIGILPKERVKKQIIIINTSFKYDFKNDIFINYAELYSDILSIMIENKFKLIEDELKYLKTFLCKKYEIKKLRIEIIKPTILDNCNVSVSI